MQNQIPSSRYRLRAAIAGLWVMGMAGIAQAGPVGSMFSGGTTGDAAAGYYSPASMTLLAGTHSMVYLSMGSARVNYQRDTPSAFDGLPYPEAKFNVASPEPYFGIVSDFGLRDWRFGVSVAVPWADGAGWDATYEGRPASTRFHGLRPFSGQLFITPMVAYRINDYLSVGLGVDVIAAFVKHEFMIDYGSRVNQLLCAQAGATTCPLNSPLVRENPATSGRVDVGAIGWDWGLAAGLLITPARWLRIALGIHTNAGKMTLPTNVTVQVPPELISYMNQTLPGITPSAMRAEAQMEYSMPFIVTAGVGVLPMDKLELALDLHWMAASEMDTLFTAIRKTSSALIDDVLLIRGRNNHYRLSGRGMYQVMEQLGLGFRLEYSSNTRPEEFVTPTSFDTWKLSFNFGLVWAITDWMDLILEYAHFILGSREVTVSRFGPKAFPTTPEEQGLDNTSPTGHYSASADRGALGFRIHF